MAQQSIATVKLSHMCKILYIKCQQGKMDADGDHNVSKEEYRSFYETAFKTMDKKGKGIIDAQNWLSKHAG